MPGGSVTICWLLLWNHRIKFWKDWLFSEKFSSNSVSQGIRTKVKFHGWPCILLPQKIKFYFILLVNDKKDPENKLVTFDSTKGKLLLKLCGVGFL